MNGKLIIKAIVSANGGKVHSEGYAEVPVLTEKQEVPGKKYKVDVEVKNSDGSPIFNNIEIPQSNAIRKALNYLGIGRFPLHHTSFGDHEMVTKFREFCIAETEAKNKLKNKPKDKTRKMDK